MTVPLAAPQVQSALQLITKLIPTEHQYLDNRRPLQVWRQEQIHRLGVILSFC